MCISHWKNQSLSQISYPGSALVGCWEITQPASNMKSFPKLLKHQFSWNYQFLKAWGIKFFPVPLQQYKNYQKSEPVPGTWWGTVLPAPLGHSFHTNSCIFMSLSLPAEFSQWCLAEPEIWELPQSYPRRCIHRPVTGEWDPWGSPLAGSKLSLALVLSSCGFWPAEIEDRESPTSLNLFCFEVGQEAPKCPRSPMQVFPASHSSLVTSTRLEKILFSALTLSKSMFGQLWEEPEVGMAAEDGPCGMRKWLCAHQTLHGAWFGFPHGLTGISYPLTFVPLPCVFTWQLLIHTQFLSASPKLQRHRKAEALGNVCVVPCPSAFSSINLLAHNLTLTGSEIPWWGSPARAGVFSSSLLTRVKLSPPAK